MELNGRQYTEIDDAIYCLPQDLHQANHSEVCSSFLGDHHHCLSGTQRREFSSPEGCLNDGDDLPHFTGSGSYSCVAAKSHTLRCLSLIPDGPLSRCSCSRSTALSIYYLPGILSSTGKGDTSMGIGRPGGGMWAYSSARSAVRFSRDTRAGGGSLLSASMYQPRIQTYDSLTRGGPMQGENQ